MVKTPELGDQGRREVEGASASGVVTGSSGCLELSAPTPFLLR